MAGALFVVSAPSGAGKTSIVKEVLSKVDNIFYSISHTTRAPRVGEVDGRDYFFVSEAVFKDMIKKGGFLEWAFVHGNYYGTSRQWVERQLSEGNDILLDIDVQGAMSLREKFSSSILIFIVPPSFSELERRLSLRASDNKEDLQLRLLNARKELQEMEKYDFIIVNDALNDAVACMISIITAMRCRTERLLETVLSNFF